MASSFGKRGPSLKWDAGVWRHFPGSEGDSLFLEELKALRKPPSNLSLDKYMDCVRAGAFRAYSCKDALEQEHVAHAFWEVLQLKAPPVVLSDDISSLLKNVQELPTKLAPLDVAKWQIGMLETMHAAQRHRPIYRLHSPVQQTLQTLRVWEQGNPTKPPLGIEHAPSWLQVYIEVRLECGSSQRQMDHALLDRWENELEGLQGSDVAVIALHLCRNVQELDTPLRRGMALCALERIAKTTASAEDVCGLFSMADYLLANGFAWQSDAVRIMDQSVQKYAQQFPESPILLVMRGVWDADNVFNHWPLLPVEMRREQILQAVDFVLECSQAQEQHNITNTNSEVWHFLEQELRALGPWDDALIDRVAQGLPALECCRKIALGMDPDMDIVQMTGEPWLLAWRHLRRQKGMPVATVPSDVFADYQFDGAP